MISAQTFLSAAFASIFLILSLPSQGSPQTIYRIPPKELVHLRPGEYLSRDYISVIEKTRSPYKADATEEPELLIVKSLDDGFSINTIGNFHEGYTEFRISSSGIISVLYGQELKWCQISAPKRGRISLGYNEYKRKEYIYIDSIDKYMHRKILPGTYIDNNGNKYIFTQNGIAHFPDATYKYIIGVDHIFSKFDYFIDSNHKCYGYRFKKNSLYLYHVHGEDDEIIDEAPFLRLIKRPNTRK